MSAHAGGGARGLDDDTAFFSSLLGRWTADCMTSSGPGMTHEEAWASEARVSLFQAPGKVLGLATENGRRIVNC